ncbi:aldehyde dehydrogenase family protein [Litorivivens sp.]|uniref:L-piperidine-6-carboxylate dehydrogenase n=1 Tax=Litorivivens sp. TaxID=2020868 RepID=UPI003562A3C6
MSTRVAQVAGLDGAARLDVYSPIDGSLLGCVEQDTAASVEHKVAQAQRAFYQWRCVPAPQRGELVRRLGEALRLHKSELAELVTRECGKIYQEGLGEVQEMIDICDFAVGLSRQLYGLTIASERPEHHMQERWQPMGVVGVITAFNFPVAVWAWNTAIALVCGNAVVWKPSEKTPLTAKYCLNLFEQVAQGVESGVPNGLVSVVYGGALAGEHLVDDKRVALVSATGSTAMGRIVAQRVAARFGRSLLELGGNNALIVAPTADLDMALRATVFGAVGTAGQRCTTTRRLLIHEQVYAQFVEKLKSVFSAIPVGNPLSAETLVGPLIDGDAYKAMQSSLVAARSAGARVLGGERVYLEFDNAWYVTPALVEVTQQHDFMLTETFAPILYAMPYREFDQAIALQNAVPQGLSSALFSNDVRETEHFLSAVGSDCGIANINIGTSGAEIGGAFGGEKETGGGRESGSDAWKAYMRRMTSTINYSRELPLAQGIHFDIDAILDGSVH